MTSELLVESSPDEKVVTVTMNRPDARNALDAGLISAMTEVIVTVGRNPRVRTAVITGTGEAFCAGTDISWMQTLARGEADVDARRLANLLFQIQQCPVPVITLINGAAAGAGVALAAASDITIADEAATFQLPAPRLGVVPAVILPFVIAAMGTSNVRRYALTGEVFSAMDGRNMGLVQAVGITPNLKPILDDVISGICAGGPTSVAMTKRITNEYADEPINLKLLDAAAKLTAAHRKTDEAKEGLSAFVEGRPPEWQSPSGG